MTVTIHLPDELVARLKSRAAANHLSIEEFAARALEEAANRPVETDEWTVQNRRRVALIRKKFSSGLTSDEETELQQLQILADRHLEALDQQMLDDVARLEATAMRIIGT